MAKAKKKKGKKEKKLLMAKKTAKKSAKKVCQEVCEEIGEEIGQARPRKLAKLARPRRLRRNWAVKRPLGREARCKRRETVRAASAPTHAAPATAAPTTMLFR